MSAGPASERLARPEQAARLSKVDGALSRSSSEGSSSAICRYSEGRYLGASALKLTGLKDPVVFETLACREALSLALNLDVASDRKGVVDDINMAWAIYMVL